MPYVNCITTKKLDNSIMDILKIHIGDLINELPGKSEEWLFVRFCEEETLYFKGKRQENAAIIEIKLFGKQEIKYKNVFTSKISSLLEDELGINKENIYVIFFEVEDGNWGFNGELF